MASPNRRVLLGAITAMPVAAFPNRAAASPAERALAAWAMFVDAMGDVASIADGWIVSGGHRPSEIAGQVDRWLKVCLVEIERVDDERCVGMVIERHRRIEL